MTSEATYWNKPLWQVKPVTETSHYDKWGELLKHAIMISEASYWINPWWQVKRVIETSHYDKWSELLKQAIMTSEASYWITPLWHVQRVNTRVSPICPLIKRENIQDI